MHIVADQNIPLVERAFGRMGNVRLLPGRHIDRRVLADATMLLVRSVTQVNEELLAGTAVRFVASATIGTDHVDQAYLKAAGIGFAYAPGSNAQSVAEYVTTALLLCAGRRGVSLDGMALGVIGVGNVGSRVVAQARALGMRCLCCDPPRQRSSEGGQWHGLDELLAAADVVTLHVPLSGQGPDRTLRMVDSRVLAALKPGAWLVNTSRGRVVDETALRAARGRLGALVLDVWEDEPTLSLESLVAADVATPHIAGYSLDGKVAGTRMIYAAACGFLKCPADVELPVEGEASPAALDVSASADAVRDAVLQAYPLERDDAALRRIAQLPAAQRGAYFDGLRRDYPRRREFRHFRARGAGRSADRLKDLGFQVTS